MGTDAEVPSLGPYHAFGPISPGTIIGRHRPDDQIAHVLHGQVHRHVWAHRFLRLADPVASAVTIPSPRARIRRTLDSSDQLEPVACSFRLVLRLSCQAIIPQDIFRSSSPFSVSSCRRRSYNRSADHGRHRLPSLPSITVLSDCDPRGPLLVRPGVTSSSATP